jgi:branched-chain amino acid transport system permease protein
MNYIFHVGTLICIYAILSCSANLLLGYTGILSVAGAAFYGIGAYGAALLALNLQAPTLLALVLACAGCGLCGAILGFPSLRLRDDAFVMATFAFQVIVFNVLNNWVDITGGPMGVRGIPLPIILGWRVDSDFAFLCLAGVLCALAVWVSRRIALSGFGRLLKAIREEETFTAAAGKNVAAFKVLVFVVSAVLSGMAGVLYAHYITFIDPTSFTVMESVFVVSIVIVGGAGSVWGPVVGAVLLVSLPEMLRFVGLPSAIAANMRQIIYGVALVACMLWRPQGLIGVYDYGREVKPK